MFEPPSLPAAGWYPDPHAPHAQRWWNGREWEPAWRTDDLQADPGRLPEIGDWLGRAFRRALLRWRVVAALSLMTGVPGSIVISLGARHLIEGVVITNEEVTGWSNDRLPLAIVLALVATLISGVGGLATAWVMLRTVDETPDLDRTERLPWREDATLAGRSLAAALPMLPRAIGWYLLLLLAVSVVAGSIVAALIVATPFGVLLIVAAIPLGAWIMLKLAFVLQAIVDRPGNPIRRSAEVSRRRWWAVCGRLLLVGVIAWAISMAINITSSIVRAIGGDNSFGTTTFEFDENGPVDPIVLADVLPLSTTAIVVGVVAGALLSVCVGGLTNAAFAELYRTRNAAE